MLPFTQFIAESGGSWNQGKSLSLAWEGKIIYIYKKKDKPGCLKKG